MNKWLECMLELTSSLSESRSSKACPFCKLAWDTHRWIWNRFDKIVNPCSKCIWKHADICEKTGQQTWRRYKNYFERKEV